MIHTLDLPWGFKAPGTQYWKKDKVTVYKGSVLPQYLRPFSSQDYSYNRWIEDELNGQVTLPEKAETKFTPRPHQLQAAQKIKKSYKEGWRGFLEADETGLGKTLSTLSAICAIAKLNGHGTKNRAKLLVVCPKGVIPVWRQTLHSYPVSSVLLRTMVINYQQLNKLMKAPPQARVAKKRRTKNVQTARHGTPSIDWDYIIFDEAQYLKTYPKSTVSLLAASIAKLNEEYKQGQSPFVVYSTATPGASPLNLSIMSGILSPLISKDAHIIPNKWPEFLKSKGFHVTKGKVEWTWVSVPWFKKNSTNPKEKAEYEKAVKEAKRKQTIDSKKIGKALLKPSAPFIKRSPKDIAGWPEQQLEPLPLELSPAQEPKYAEAWSRFRAWLRLPGSKKDSKSALVENLRYRQKSSLLKVEPMAAFVQELVEQDKQVYISCEFVETVDAYRKAFEKAKIPVAEVTGRTSDIREDERIRFQKGQAKIVLCSVVAGVSFHAEEILPDGSKATPNSRITIIHDIRQNNLDADQSLGRAHRDGQNSLAYFPYFVKTVDEKVVSSYTNKRRNMKTMLGSSDESAMDLEVLFEKAAIEDNT